MGGTYYFMGFMLDEWEVLSYMIIPSFQKVIHPNTIQGLGQLNLKASMRSRVRPWIKATCSMVGLCPMGPDTYMRLQLNHNIHMFLSSLRPQHGSKCVVIQVHYSVSREIQWMPTILHKNFDLRPSTPNNISNICCCRDLSNNNFSGPVDFYGFNGYSQYLPEL